jgi:hypothetical protein
VWVVLIDTSRSLLALIMFAITAFLLFDIVRNMPFYYQAGASQFSRVPQMAVTASRIGDLE